MCFTIVREISGAKFEVEPFDGRNNFSLWQSILKDILVQQGLYKALKGREKKPESSDDKGKEKKKDGMSDNAWEELEMKAVSTIRLCLAPEDTI